MSSEINSNSIKVFLLSKIFYDDKIVQEMITNLMKMLKRDELSRDVTSNNENMIILNNEIEEQIIYMRKAIKMIKQHKIKKNKELNQKIRLIERNYCRCQKKNLNSPD